MWRKRKKIHLVMGVSSSGKSSFIESRINNGKWRKLPTFMAYELNEGAIAVSLPRECIVHYNLFRPYDSNIENQDTDFLADPVLKALMKKNRRINAYFIIAHSSEIKKRILLREALEPNLRENAGVYPREAIFELLCRIDLEAFHNKWFLLLKEFNIPFEIVESSNSRYVPLSSRRDAFKLLSKDYKSPYSNKEIDYIAKTHKFEYQKIEISTKKYTYGEDRSETLRFFDEGLVGKSVLDIGCAFGYFCFEAEKRNASRVVGTELKRHRFIGCNILKEIFGSNIEILFQDIFSNPLKEKFDIVLLLNVLHHLKEPIKALRIVSEICTQKLIIEFSMLSDKKFMLTVADQQEIDPFVPLIGVGLFSTQDQTFLFSREAIKRILLDHDRLFSAVEFEPSPMSHERCIAICHK